MTTFAFLSKNTVIKGSQLILALLCMGLLTVLFIFGKTRTPMDKALADIQKASSPPTKTVKELDFEKFLNQFSQKLPIAAQDSINLLSEKLSASTNESEKQSIHTQIANIWENYRLPGPQAYYLEKNAQMGNDAEIWEKAGRQYFIASRLSKDTLLNPWYADKAVTAYEMGLEIAPEDLDAKVGLAKVFIDGKNEVMRGVFTLREVVAVDSTHIEANLTLGRLSVFSKQFDKAVTRLEKVVLKDSTNSEAHYYLGESFLGLGNKTKALEHFETCKTLVQNPAFIKELDMYINNIISN